MVKVKRGFVIDKIILTTLQSEEHPISTRELSLKTKISWHSVINHCLRLQMNNKIIGYKVGNLNVWCKKNE